MKKTTKAIIKHTALATTAMILNAVRFLFRNIVDFLIILSPLPYSSPTDGKKILIFNWRDTAHSFAGGAEVYVHEMAKRWVRAGHTVTLFCGNDGQCSRYEVVDGVEIIRRGGFYFVYIWAFFYYLVRFRGRYDIIIDCENGIPFFTPLYAKEKKYLVIHHVHQEVFRTSLRPPLSWIASYLEMHVMPHAYKHIDVITVSQSSKEDIIRYKLSTHEPSVIHNGVDLTAYKPGIKSKDPLILYLGRLKYYKSVHIFIRAAKKIIEKVPSARFVIAGDGEEYDHLKKLARRIGIDKHVHFTGKVTNKEKIKLYQQAWVFVNPSFMEGWGITSIEANACGTPVIASDVPGLRDAIQHASTGFLVPYGNIDAFADKILHLITDYAHRIQMSQDALQWAQKFDWNISAERALDLFNGISNIEVYKEKPVGQKAVINH